MTPVPELDHLQYQRAKYATRNPISQRLMRGFFAALKEAVRFVHRHSALHTIVEFGCGEGVSTWHVQQAAPGTHVFGFDLHRPSVEIARRVAPSTSLLVGDVTRAPLASGSADLVVMLEVLEHLDDPSQALIEAARVSRGWCIFSVPHEPIWRVLNLARGAYWRSLGNTPGHVNHWSSRSWHAFLTRHVDVVRMLTPLPWLMAVCHTR